MEWAYLVFGILLIIRALLDKESGEYHLGIWIGSIFNFKVTPKKESFIFYITFLLILLFGCLLILMFIRSFF